MTSIILTELSNPHVLVIVVHLFVHFCREAINLELISSQLSDMMQTLHGNFKRRYPSLHMPSIFLNISSRVDTKEKSPNLTLKIERSSLCHISSVACTMITYILLQQHIRCCFHLYYTSEFELRRFWVDRTELI